MRFLDFPPEVQQLALFIDSDNSWILLLLSLIHIGIFCSFFITKVSSNILYKIVLLIAILDLPIIVFAALYIAGLPKA